MKKDKRYKVEIEWNSGVISVSWYNDFETMDDRLEYLRSECFGEYVQIIVTDTPNKRRMNEFYEIIK